MIWNAYHVTDQIHIDKFYSFFQAHFQKGYHFPGEAHNFWECVYVINGGLCVSGDERIYNLTEGQIIFHKPLEFHKFSINDCPEADLLIFSFSMEGNMCNYFKNKVFNLSESQKSPHAS